MATKRNVQIDLSVQLNEKDLQKYQKSFDELLNLKILDEDQIKEFETVLKRFEEIKKMMDPTDEAFINQESIENATLLFNEISGVSKAFEKLKKDALKGVKFKADTEEIDKELKAVEKKIKEIKQDEASKLGISAGGLEGILTGEGELASRTERGLKNLNFAEFFKVDSEQIGSMFKNPIKNADAVLNRLSQIQEALGKIEEGSDTAESVVARFLPDGAEEADIQRVLEMVASLDQAKAAVDDMGQAQETIRLRMAENKEIKELLEQQTNLESARKKEEEAAERLQKKTKELNETREDEEVLLKQNLRLQEERAQAEEKALAQKKADSDSVSRLIERYTSFAAILALTKKAATEAFRALSNLDAAFTEMAIVTDYSRKQIWAQYGAFQAIAKVSGFTTAEVASVTAEYLKQGETFADSLVLTEAATKAAQVASIDTADSVRYLTSAVRGYRLEAEDAMLVSDKFAAVAAATATDYDGIATAMSKVAAQAYANNVEMDNLMGLLSTAMDVTQEAPENIGTAFKTIFARMTQISDYGKTLEDGMNINKVEDALSLVGVALRTTENEMRPLDDILLEVGSKWGTLNSMQKAYITNTLAGTRQQTRLLAVFENYDLLLDNITTSQEAAGATAAQQAKYMEGLEAAQNKVSIAWENLIQVATESEFFIGALEAAANGLNSIAQVLENPVWSKFITLILGAMTVKGGFRVGGMFLNWLGTADSAKKLLSFLKLVKNDIAGIGALAADETFKLTSFFGSIGASAGKAGLGIGSIATGVGIAGVAIMGLIAVYNFFYEDATEKSERLNEELVAIEGNIYNISKTQGETQGLIDEYEELANKAVKTNEELERMKDLAASIAQFDMDGELTLLDTDGFLLQDSMGQYGGDLLNLQTERLLAEQEAQMATMRELFVNFTDNQEEIAGDMDKATDYLIAQYTGMEAYLEMSNREKAIAKMFAEQAIQNAEETWLYYKIGGEGLVSEEEATNSSGGPRTFEGYRRKKGVDTDALEESFGLDVENAQRVAEILENVNSTPIKESAKALRQIMGEGLENLTDTDPLARIIMQNEDLNITYESLQRLGPVLQALGDKAQGFAPHVKEAMSAAQESGDLVGYLTRNMDSLELTMGEVAGAVLAVNKATESVSTENLVAGLSNLESFGDRLNSINETLENNNWGADSLREVMALMEEYPALSEDIIDSIIAKSAIDQETKEAMLASSKEMSKREIELAIAEKENQIKLAELELEAIGYLIEDEAALIAMAEQGKTDMSKLTTEEIIGHLSKENENVEKALTAQLKAYDQTFSKIQAASDALRSGNYGGMDTSISAGFDPAPVFSGTGYDEEIKDIQDQLRARQGALSTSINNYSAQIKALQKTHAAIDSLELGEVTGASKDKGGGSGGGSGGGKSAASEKAEYYLGVLNKLYVAEQRVRAAELFSERNNAAIEYARSIEALGDSYEGQREGYESSAKLIEEQYALYAIMGEQQEHLIATLEDYQKGLKEGLNPALLKTFKVIDGRIIPISEEYGKLNAENMEILDKFAESFNNYADSIDDATQASIEYKVAQNELLADMRDAVIEWQEVMIEAIKNEEKKYLDSFKKLIDANKDYLNERKKLYQDSFDAEDTESKLQGIEEERLSLTERIAALEGAHDQQSLKRKADYIKQLEDLNTQYNELTLQYNRDAFMQRIDDQIAYQDEVYAKEEEAYNERISDAQWLEDRIAEISRDARIQALIDQGLHNMSIEDLIKEGYITHEQATAAGLDNIKGTVSGWSTAEKQALADHFANNTKQFESAWGDKTAEGQPGAEGIVKAAIGNIIKYLKENHPQIEGATSAMRAKIVADWNAMTKAASEYTKNFDGITLGAPNHTALSKGLAQITTDIKNAADAAEREYARIKAAQEKATSGTSSGSKTSTTTGTPTPATPTKTYRATMYAWVVRSSGIAYENELRPTLAEAKAWYPNNAIHSYSHVGGGKYKIGGIVYTPTSLKQQPGGVRHTAFATGGTTERTGFHWLDGSPGKPERVLSPGQDQEFQSLLATLATESELRTSSYVSLASLDQMNQLLDSLDHLGVKLVTSEEISTETLANELRKVASVVEHTSKQEQNHVLKTLTMNRKY